MLPKKLACYSELADLPTSIDQFHSYNGRYVSSHKHAIIYSCLGEVLTDAELVNVLETYKNKKVAILTTRQYPKDLLENYTCKVFYIPTGYAYYATEMQHIDVTFNREFDKIFLSFNNRAQWNRQALYQFLLKFNLLDKFYFSYLCHDRFNNGFKKTYNDQNTIIGHTWFNENLNLDEAFNQLPFTLDLFKGNDWGVGNRKFYETSFCSFVNETYIDENYNVFLTEKSMKPLAYGHPMLLFSSAGALTKLRELGFKTYDLIFDESYDVIDSPQQRFEQLLKIVLELCQKSNKELNLMYNTIKPVLEHNYNHFWNELPKMYSKDIVQVKKEILDFFNL